MFYVLKNQDRLFILHFIMFTSDLFRNTNMITTHMTNCLLFFRSNIYSIFHRWSCRRDCHRQITEEIYQRYHYYDNNLCSQVNIYSQNLFFFGGGLGWILPYHYVFII